MGEQNRAMGQEEETSRPTPTRMTTVIPSDTSYLQYLAAVAKEFCRVAVGALPEIDEQFYFNIELVMTEAVVNSIKHAYGDKAGPVEFSLEWTDQILSMRVVDYGSPFTDFDAYAARDIDELDPLSTSGRGIIIIRSLMDHVQYTTEPETGRNELTMSKSFPAAPQAESGD